MSFPLADWILDHPGLPHNLGQSGLVGSLESVPRVLREPPIPPEADRVQEELARLHHVETERVFLTHGATEANALTLLYLARTIGRSAHRTPRLHAPIPDYPPIAAAGVMVGFRRVDRPESADAVALSAPRNPTGQPVGFETFRSLAEGRAALVVDQTFREFTPEPPATDAGPSNLWVTGSFTKVYGADDLRLGYAIPPEAERKGFGALHGLLLDQVPPASISGALAILAHREEILAESRALLSANTLALRARLPEAPPLAAPVWFDRGPVPIDGDRFAQELLRDGILVCPGSFFGDRQGVRIGLTRRSFPADLDAYCRGRERFVGNRSRTT
ncbi:MAG TPA: aminotransferase class I/II-fold pyridoxal phosphate-dependent enzyme [Thermoplasmata archaeon]|nr:aminotransferase class I/II-fold pyridoxal phosphate-dependent enzyme [Thermoplasmata archaeon]